jgi:ribosomal protein S12
MAAFMRMEGTMVEYPALRKIVKLRLSNHKMVYAYTYPVKVIIYRCQHQ